MNTFYTTQLQAGLGLIDETLTLLDLWQPGMEAPELQRQALASGRFSTVSARRIRNIVTECFKPRYLVDNGTPAARLQQLRTCLGARELEQLFFLYTCRANAILADFVREIYWVTYVSGRDHIDNDEARAFVVRAVQDGKTAKSWSDTTIRRISSYLIGCCTDFGLLERTQRAASRIQAYRLEPRTAAYLAYDLHIAGLGENSIVEHADWRLFGREPLDVLNELQHLARRNLWILQSVAGASRITWSLDSMEELLDVFAADDLR
jgi:hypothetical protein